MEMNLDITSSAFVNNESIPLEYTGKGKDISPPLEIDGIIPEGRSLVIVMDDPDAGMGVFTHWIIWNIPASYSQIPADIPGKGIVASLGGAIQGINDFNVLGYKGPKPPSGTHTYRIKAYVLDNILDLKPGADAAALADAIEGHVLQYGLLRGKVSH
ncbi:MAG: YbhB/YbcL family Raf kinase inhibitor-like protein [Saccharofermentanales bacterium]